MREDFAIFILTHGRPHNQRTVEALNESGYTGKVYLVLDDLDDTREEYCKLYNNVLVFNKYEYVSNTDTGLTKPYINFAVFARNAIEDFAKKLGYKYFGMFDDDIHRFRHRIICKDQLLSEVVVDLDSVIDLYLEFMEDCNLACTSFGVSTQFIGGLKRLNQCSPDNNSLRLCYNAYIRNVMFDVKWKTNLCEDRITSIYYNTIGQVWQQLIFIQIDTAPLYGEVEGGNSSVYRQLDDFTKVFFPIVTNPNSNYVSVYRSGNKDYMITHIVGEHVLCPKIISGGYVK